MCGTTVSCFKDWRCFYELGNDLDELVWHYILFGDQYGLLDWNGSRFIDCNYHECCILGNEAPKKQLIL